MASRVNQFLIKTIMDNMQPVAAQEPAIPQAGADGKIDVNAIIDKIQVPPNLKSIYDKAIVSGLRIMFDKKSHKMLLEQLDKPEPMEKKLSEGIITLVYMLWTESNKTLPPQILVPITVTLTLRAFEFLQDSGDQEATKEALGEAMHMAVVGLMERCGVPQDQLQQMANKVQGGAANGGGLIQQGA